MSIAVTGASGFIGSALVKKLGRRGARVLCIARSPERTGERSQQHLLWDPMRGTMDTDALESLDAVIHLAGEPIARRWTKSRRETIRSSRIAGTRLLAQTLARLNSKPTVLLSASAVGIYGSRGDELLEETSTTGSDFLAETAVQWEAATQAAQDAGIRVVHLRTGIVLGPGGGVLGVQLPLFRVCLGATVGSGSQWMSPISLSDHVDAMLHCLSNDQIRGPVNLVSPEAVTNEQYTHELANVLRRPAIFRVPASAIRALMGAEMADLTALASQRVKPRVLLESGFRWRHPTLESMLRSAVHQVNTVFSTASLFL